jgi:deoxyribodipyrimidine photo-lyase
MRRERSAFITFVPIFSQLVTLVTIFLFGLSFSPATHAFHSVPKQFAARSVSSFSQIKMIINPDPVHHIPKSELPEWFIPSRSRILTDPQLTSKTRNAKDGSVVYWMQRDMRARDNWALCLASYFAAQKGLPLRVVYAFAPPPTRLDPMPSLQDLPMTRRHGNFLLGGLELVHKELETRKIPMHFVMAESHESVGEEVCRLLLEELRACLVVSDFSPLRQFREWMELQATPILNIAAVPFYQVDTHNIVPVWIAAPNRQVGARTLRPKINNVIKTYLKEFPVMAGNTQDVDLPKFERDVYDTYLKIDETVKALDWAIPGTDAGMQQFRKFCQVGLPKYNEDRNDPVQTHICSNLSSWINHGHISFQRLTMEVYKLNKYPTGVAGFVEEGVVRRELSDNYVYYVPNHYDSLDAAADWAKESLQLHAADSREHLYSTEDLEQGKTHDELWNAAQLQLVREGGMHGFMRMYWAKKILEWTESPEIALKTSQYFNDRYALDGKDPNGFVGVGWSIMGIHDQGWQERPVFGKIRYMNYNGCKRK